MDRETGLVWETSPSTSGFTWKNAQIQCNQSTVGNRKGWRLPTLQELASLVDPTATSSPALPAGHPFTNVQSGAPYWSATSAPGFAWSVVFSSGGVNFGYKFFSHFTWCVRGGHGVNPQ